MKGPRRHRPTAQLVAPLPAEVEAGATLEVEALVSCPEGCDLQGASVTLTTPDSALEAAVLGASPDADRGPKAAFVLEVPARTGEASWTVSFPEHESAGHLHEACTLTLVTRVVPHSTSIAIWDVPSPLPGSAFSVRVGIKCSALCNLGGRPVEVRGETGELLGEARLGDDPHRGTEALFEAEVSLTAAPDAGIHEARVVFAASDSGLPHQGTSGVFTYRCLEPPDHRVTVKLVPEGLEAPLGGVEIRLGGYRTMTDGHGVARVDVAEGTYELSAWRIDIDSVSMEIDVTEDARFRVDVRPRTVEDEDEKRMWM